VTDRSELGRDRPFSARFRDPRELPPLIADAVSGVSEGRCLLCQHDLGADGDWSRCARCGFSFRIYSEAEGSAFEINWNGVHCAHYDTVLARSGQDDAGVSR